MKIRSIITIIAGVLLLSVAVVAAPPPGLEIQRHVIGGGGAPVSRGTYGLDFTIGQPLVEGHRSGDTGVGAGFWAKGAAYRTAYLPLVIRNG